MKRSMKIAASLFCMVLMVNMIFIDARANSLIVQADLRVAGNQFTADVGEEIIFNASLTQGPWQTLIFFFHDGSEPLTTTNPIVSHAFPIEGKFFVTLLAIGVGGISSQDGVEITIVNTPPSASILMNTSASEDELVTLQAIDPVDTPNDVDTLQYRWILGDGNVQTGAEIQYAWSYAGTYTVTLQVLDDQLSMYYETKDITISNVPPTAEFEIHTEQDPDGTYISFEDITLEFNASATQDSLSDYKNLRIYWDFGDGTVGRGRELHHTYHESGIYTVKLLVLDDDGEASSIEKTIEIRNIKPLVDIIDNDIVLLEGQTYTFTAESQDTFTDFQRLLYAWSFGKSGWRASHTWTDDWNGQASVQVQDPEGLTDTDYVNVEVLNVPPKASVSMAFIKGDLTLRAAGTPNNTIELKIFGSNQLISNFTLDRIPGDPDSQAITIPFLFDLTKYWRIEVSYETAMEGANPTWLTFAFTDHSTKTYFHNFVVDQEQTWNWNFYPQDYRFSWPLTFNGTIFDPGSDSVTGEVKFNSISILNVSHQDDGTWPVEIPFEITVRPTASSLLEVTAEDDDGGTDYISINVFYLGGSLIWGLAPRIELAATTQTSEEMPVDFTSVAYSPGSLQYIWDFGDGESLGGANVSHTYSNSGEYLVQLTVTDSQSCSTTRGFVIQIENFIPVVEIMGIFNSTEDYKLSYEPLIYESPSDEDSLRYFWIFGDGAVATGFNVSHSYAYNNTYPLSLKVTDDNGAIGTQTVSVIVHDEHPIVDGPYGFGTAEGTTIIADVYVYDSTVDEPNLQYRWNYNSETSYSHIFTTSQDDGFYNVSLTITDPGTISISDNITLAFINDPPVVVASSFILYGASTSLDLKAFAMDSYLDTPELTYEWVINDEIIPDGQGLSSSVSMEFYETRTYHGYVAVSDDSDYVVYSEFSVVVVIDSDGDGLTDELEILYGTNATSSDSDGDYLSDQYEIEESKTNPNAWDSDNDSLCDGLDTHPNVMTGELILGTDPWNPDTDMDNLTDGEEVLGWDITVYEWIGDNGHYNETPKVYTVYSNPLRIDTDNDGLTDWEEKYRYENYDPKKPDTDGDGISDLEDSGRGARFDSDNDGLSDSLESTLITSYVPMEYEYTLTADSIPASSWSDALEMEGDIENTQVNDENSWTGRSRVETSPLYVSFEGVFNSITTKYNKFLAKISVSANESDADFQLWDWDKLDWITYKTFSESTTEYIIFTTDEENAAQWIHDGTLMFRISSGYNEEMDGEDLYYDSYIEIFYAQVEGVFKYPLSPDSTWLNAYEIEIEGDIEDAQVDDANAWFGRRKVPASPLHVTFEGVFNSITTENNRLTVRARVSADDAEASFQLWDGEYWVPYQTFEESTTEYIVLCTDETNASQWIHDGTLMFRIESGYNEELWWWIPEYDSYIEIFYAQIEEVTIEETTLSDPELYDTDGDGLSDWEEYYPGEDGYITCLRNNDTDSDDLLDSAEGFSITKEYGKRERVSMEKNAGEFSPTVHEFYFSAIVGGKARNATVLVGFSSATDLKINLIQVKVAGILVVHDVAPDLEEPEEGIAGTVFYKGYDITQNTTIFSGEWKLTLDMEPLNPDDPETPDEVTVLLENFKAEVALRLAPTNPDWDKDGLFDGHELNASVSGWITNPRVWDSDGDFWSDRDEIYKYNTNPLSTDTDGDGVDDPYDRDPHHNLMLKITVQEGHYHNAQWTRRLAVVIKVEGQAVATPDRWANESWVQRGWWIFKRWVARTSVFDSDYYFDIPDQRTAIQIGVELWKISWLWDTELLDKTYTYSVGTGNDPNPTPTETVSDGDGDWVRFNISTLGMKRVNTLAIISNGSFFNGHYTELERFTMVILGIDGTPDPDSPFKEGVNVILIPVSLFIRTQLHSMWEHEDIPSELGTGSVSEKEAKFHGLDPDSETVSQYVEGLIIKGLENGDFVTPEEALAILAYLLKNETGYDLYKYYVCDEAGEVEGLGLAKDILDLIPFDAQAMANDPTGPMPKGFWDWLISIFVTIILFIVFVVISPFIFLGLLIAALIYIGITLIGPLLEAAVLAVIKLIILVYVFILLAIALLGIILGFIMLVIALLVFTLDQPGVFSYGFLWYELDFPTVTLRFEIIIVFEKSSFIDLSIPCLKIAVYQDGQQIFAFINSFGIPIDSKPITQIISEESENPLQTSGEDLSIDHKAYNDGKSVILFYTIIAMLGVAIAPGFFSWILYISSIIVATICFPLVLFSSMYSPEYKRGFLAGYGLGMFEAGAILCGPILPPKNVIVDTAWAILTFGGALLIKEALFPEYHDDPAILAYYSVVLTVLSAILYNQQVENELFPRAAWAGLSLFFVLYGLSIAAFIRWGGFF